MEMPIEVIEAVKHKEQEQLSLGLEKRTFVKDSSKRIVVEVKRGLRSVGAIAKSLNLSRPNAYSALKGLVDKGYLVSKKAPSGEVKYYLSSNAELIASLKLEKLRTRKPKKVAKVAKVAKVVRVAKPDTKKPAITREQREVSSEYSLEYIRGLERDVVFKAERISQLELSLAEKEKEVWTLECEVFDKKAIITYLESKMLGVK